MCMALGAESVFVGSGICLSEDAPRRARAIVTAVTCWEDAAKLAEVSTALGKPMRSVEVSKLESEARFAARGA
jgi:pyridoxal 5'-phosphate synthase pdxS subunit